MVSQTRTQYTREELETLDHSDLVQRYLDLHGRASTAPSTALALLTPTSSQLNSKTSASTPAWSDLKITETAHKLRLTIGKEIKEQMKWQPSRKTGTTKWCYPSAVAHEDVFY